MLGFAPRNCTLAQLDASVLRGRRLMLLGDSVMMYQFRDLVELAQRDGLALRCVAASQPEWPATPTSSSAAAAQPSSDSVSEEEAAAVRSLALQDPYGGQPLDCEGEGGTLLMSRRLNLLPIGDEQSAALLGPMLAPLGRDGVAVVNVGLWAGPLARHPSLQAAAASHAGGRSKAQREARAVELARLGVASFVRAACRHSTGSSSWPRAIVWREALPQHFGGGGEYRRHRNQSSCAPLGDEAARQLHAKFSMPMIRTVQAGAQAGALAEPSCGASFQLLPAFFPLVSRHAEHLGAPQPSARGASGAVRADCTHWRPCSSATALLHRLLFEAVGRAR